MKNIALLLITLILVSGCDELGVSDAHRDYDALKAELLPLLLIPRAFDEKTQSEFEAFILTWVKVHETASFIENDALAAAGIPQTIDGFVDLMTEPAPAYSRSDETANRRGAGLMQAQAILLPVTTDGYIHYSKERAMIKINDRRVTVYEMHENAVVCWLYKKPE